MSPRPQDPRAGVLCTSCNRRRDQMPQVRKHCRSKTCTWWVCPACKAINDETGANDITNRDGSPRKSPRS